MSKKLDGVLPSFVECDSVQDANLVDMSEYRFDRFSEKRQKYIFVRRSRRMGL